MFEELCKFIFGLRLKIKLMSDADIAAVINAIDEKAKRELNTVKHDKEDKLMNPFLPGNTVYGALLAPRTKYNQMYKTAAMKGNYYDIFKKWLPKEEVPEFLNKKMNLSEEQLLEKEDDDITEILTAKQLAEKMGLSVSTVLRDCRRGVHPGAQKVDGKWLIPYSGLVGGSKNDN